MKLRLRADAGAGAVPTSDHRKELSEMSSEPNTSEQVELEGPTEQLEDKQVTSELRPGIQSQEENEIKEEQKPNTE
jgi:hypothetical protein